MTKRLALPALVMLMLPVTLVFSQEASDETRAGDETRVGTCEDAKSQMEYFCDPSRGENDTMVQMGTACNNAKNNVKEACEGIVEQDKEYKFSNN